MKVGYMRVSTKEQNLDRQLEILKEAGVERIFEEKVSGKSANRPQLQEMLAFVREGDTVVVESISRLARNTRDLLEIVDSLKQKGVGLVSLKENIDTGTPAGQFMLTLFGAMAELEREYILSRQREGIEIAKAKGVYKGRKSIEVDLGQFLAVYDDWMFKKITAREAMRRLGLKPSTFYRKVKEYRANGKLGGSK